ncbi:MAG: hypothetical protein D6B26_07535 [Spirochaetaceae bacterium]|nr:MAG: hypothetical protein D6B26_07535 [Spirochaetaceae bacterium]
MQDYPAETIQGIIRLLNENKIQTEAIYEPIGCTFHPSPQDIVSMIRDRDAFFANECGISKSEYQDWKKCVAGGFQCTAHNKQGEQCRKRISGYRDLSPQQFVERKKNGTLKCAIHLK